MHVAEDARSLRITLPLSKGRPRTVTITPHRTRARVAIEGPKAGPAIQAAVTERVRHVLRLDEDLSGFYAQLTDDPDLAWAAAGAGRMVRAPTVFEEVVKTVCTTNCSWGATKKMVAALVSELGEPAAGAPPSGPDGRAFPTPEAMAASPERFYKEVMRAGYRGPYFRSLAKSVVRGEVDLEALATSELPDEEVAVQLQALPGVGPYAAAHIMMMIGRYSLLILDSWTRPKYARLVGKKSVKDSAIVRRFKPYGSWAGLAFWLFLTRDWLEDGT
jgi:N-glycosylase/DNA lyase